MTRLLLLALASLAMMAWPAGAGGGAQLRFPLRLSDDHRRLLDADANPVFVNGEAAWSLIAELTREETDFYLADRKRRGFNALLVNLVEHRFSTDPPRNAYGDAPFKPDAAFRDLGEAYFRHAAWVLERAEQEGFIILLVPAYLGVGGGEEGWYGEVQAAGEPVLRAYGQAIARRFAQRRNIIWVHGGDYDVPDEGKALVRAVIDGIRDVSPTALHTLHGSRESIPAETWGSESWLSLDTAYTYGDVFARVAAQTSRDPPRPVVLIEGTYENERDTTEEDVRRQAYGALLAGGAGHVFGNNPVWHFGSSGVFASDQSWRDALASRGAQSITHLASLLRDVPWWTIGRGTPCSGLTAGAGSYVGCSADGTLSIAYLYATETAMVRVSPGDGEVTTYRWYDPAGGHWWGPAIPVGLPETPRRITPPTVLNAGGFADWVLVVRRSHERMMEQRE